MSQAAIRAALETALDTIVPALATGYENKPFKPPLPTVPYQLAYVKFAMPENIEQGRGYNEIGYMQVTLQYPLNAGSADATARGKSIRDLFRKGASFTSAGVTVTVTKTAEVGNGFPDGDRWALAVKVPFMAQIYS